MRRWLEIAGRPDVVRRSLRVAAVVGTLLVLINYADRLLSGQTVPADWLKMVLTYCVPYAVSTYASVSALRNQQNATANPENQGTGQR